MRIFAIHRHVIELNWPSGHQSYILSFIWFDLENMTDFMTLDIGGTIFKTKRQTLLKFPSTRLGKMASGIHTTEASPFDRNQIIFPNILDFYRLGELHLPKNMCAAVIVKELDFWEIDQSYISECCLKLLTDYEDSVQKQLELKKSLEDVEVDYNPDDLQHSKVKQISRQIWLFFDCPKSSKLAFVNLRLHFPISFFFLI